VNRQLDIEKPVIRWFAAKQPTRVKAVALMIHGLNLNPMRMKAVAELLTERNIDVCLLSLSGHGENYQGRAGQKSYLSRLASFREVSYRTWRDETRLAHDVVREQAAKRELPVLFVGYSLGGLMGCDLLASAAEPVFDGMILFAPALTTHLLNRAFKVLFPLKKAVIPSMSPRHYRANAGTPIAAYMALLDAGAHFSRRASSERLNIPTVVFIDKQDELVSFNRLKKFIVRLQLDRWEMVRVRKNILKSVFKYNHLIIDEQSAGEAEWEKIRRAINDFLDSSLG